MSTIKLNTNVASLLVQRNLATATSNLQTNFERLSSGLRINSAKDDAAGLAMAESLNADARVYTQAIRNVNDGISLLNVAEAALNEMSSIVTRQIELAEQASNGTLSSTQRIALHKEANALVEEFNRIVGATSFNDISVIDGSTQEINVQAGYETSNAIEVVLTDALSQTTGDGTFQSRVTYDALTEVVDMLLIDVNSDGHADMISAHYTPGRIGIAFGNGDGTFQASVSIDAAPSILGLAAADFNNDGVLDIATGSGTGGNNALNIHIGNGDGTFLAKATYATGGRNHNPLVADYNGDGILDVAVNDTNEDVISVFMGVGDGTFAARTTYQIGTNSKDMTQGDFNGDGILDIITPNDVDNTFSLFLGNSDGSFLAPIVTSSGDSPHKAVASDFNNDGYLDFALANQGDAEMAIYLGNGDGTFEGPRNYATSTDPSDLRIADLDGDGLDDLVASGLNGSAVDVFINKGDGTFNASVTLAAGSGPRSIAVDDIDGDGATDIVAGDWYDSQVSVYIANTQQLSTMEYINLSTQEEALDSLTTLEDTLDRVTLELGSVGAARSRFTHTINNLQQIRENYLTAESQIRDADVATEAAELVRNQILQQAAASVLAQANQQSDIALVLLGTGIG